MDVFICLFDPPFVLFFSVPFLFTEKKRNETIPTFIRYPFARGR